MEVFLIIILVLFFGTNSLDKAESVQFEELEELQLQTFDELFVDEWWDNDKAEEWSGQIEPNSTDQLGQIEPNSTDQLRQIEPNSTDQNPSLTESDQSGQIEPNSTDQNSPLTESDHSGQIEHNLTDQNPPLTTSDHSDNAKNGEEQNEIIKEITSNEKRKIIDKFVAIKEQFKQKGKFPYKERVQIEEKIAKYLKVNRTKIYKWKNELGLSPKKTKNERKNLIEKFNQRKAELKRDGFKNSQNEINKTVSKELGLSFITIYRWKRKLGQIKPKHKYGNSKQMELMKLYYEIKDKTPKISDEKIAKRLKIARDTLRRWKKQFKQQQFHLNSVDGLF